MKKNMLEWVVFAVSLVLILGVIGSLVLEAVTQMGKPALLRITPEDPVQRGEHHLLPFVIENTGGKTASEVAVEATNGEETSALTMPFVPRHSKREGTFVFTQPVDVGALKLRILGYEEP